MKKKTVIIIMSLFLISCQSQEKKNMNIEERLSYIKSNVKKYNFEPLYQIDIETLNNFQILVNGFPIYTHNHSLPGTIKFNINSAILKSGNQDLEIRIYPSYKDKNSQNEYLSNKDYFHLKVEQTAWDTTGSLDEPKLVLEYEKPENDAMGREINYDNLKEYKQKLSFNAEVPYTLKGWSESKDLTKIDSIEYKALSFYKKIIESFKDKDYDLLNSLYLKADTEWYQAEYFPLNIVRKYQTKEGRKGKSISTIKANANTYEQNMFALDNYEIKLYSENKVLRIEFASGVNKGNSIFGYDDIDSNGFKRQVFVDLFLHIPIGKEDFEIIR